MAGALLFALGAWLRARALARRLERLTDSYWELRYESGQLKARVARLEVTTGQHDEEPVAAEPPRQTATSFVPLSSLKK